MADRVQGPPARGRITRTAPLVGLAGRTAGEAVITSLRRRARKGDGAELTAEFHARTAERYVRLLGRSKGVLMKAGQMLSFVTFGATVGQEYRAIYQTALTRLQDDAPPMPPELAMAMIEAELGSPANKLFAEWSPEPLAAASIGQVHAARLHDGRRVVVKVQYPGVEQAIRADLDNTELLATFFQLLRAISPGFGGVDLRAMAREVTERIGEEIDYRTEARNQADFADAYRGHPFIRVPEVVPELSTRRVFTMERSDGMRWAAALEADQELRDRWGEAIYRFSLGGLRRLRLFNADPHPGNYLFHPDGAVTFLDYGCVKRFTPEQVASIQGLVTATVDRDAQRLLSELVDAGFIGVVDAPTPEQALAWFSEMLKPVLAPQPFTYTPEHAGDVVVRDISPVGPHREVLNKLTMDPDFLFTTRIDLGVTAVLGELRAGGPFLDIVNEWDRGGPAASPLGELDLEFWGRK